jgi:hypothetical protein
MYEVEALVFDACEKARTFGDINGVPAHVRQNWRLELFNNAGPLAYAWGIETVFNTMFEHDLKTNTDAEHWATASNSGIDQLWSAHCVEAIHACCESANTRHDESVAVQRSLVVSSEFNFSAHAFESADS